NTINTFVIALPLIYFGQKYFGIEGVAYAVCIHYTTSRIAFHYFMKKYIHITDMEVMYALKDPTLAALVMLVIIYLITLVGMAVLLELLVAGLLGGLVYLLFFLNDLKQGIRLIKKH